MPVPILEVNYEETVTDLESTARRMIEACGLAWEPACLEFHRTERPIRTASVMQVRQPVYQRSVARWKNYEPALAELFAGLPQDDEPAPLPIDDSLACRRDVRASTGRWLDLSSTWWPGIRVASTRARRVCLERVPRRLRPRQKVARRFHANDAFQPAGPNVSAHHRG